MLLEEKNPVTSLEATTFCTVLTVSCMDFDVSVNITCTTTVKVAALLEVLCARILMLVSGTPSSVARSDRRLLRTEVLTCCEKVNVMFTTYSDAPAADEDSVGVVCTQALVLEFNVVPDGHPFVMQEPKYRGDPDSQTVQVLASVQFWQLSGQFAHFRSASYVPDGHEEAHVPWKSTLAP